MNLLGKAGCQLAKTGFGGFAKVLDQKVFVRRMGSGAVLLAGRLLAVTGGRFEEVFPHVVRVAGIGVQHAAFGQVRGHCPPAGLVGFAAGVGIKVDWRAGSGGHDLHLEAVELAPLARAAAVIRLARQQFTARDARVVAHGDRKRVNDVAGLGAQGREQLPKRGKQARQRISQGVQLAIEPALIQVFLAPLLRHVALAQHQVATNVAGRDQGRGQHLRVVEATARVRLAGRHGTDMG